MKSRIIVVLTLALLLSCSSEPICLYNPSSESILVQLDGEEYNLESGDTVDISISSGEYQMTTIQSNEEIFNQTITITDSIKKFGGYINPTNEPLFLITEKFSNSDLFNFGEKPRALFNLCDININPAEIDIDSLATSLMDKEGYEYSFGDGPTFLIDCFLIIGDIVEYRQKVIVKEWDYGINTDMPSSIMTETVKGLESVGSHKSKICSQSYLVKYYESNYKIYKRLFPDEDRNSAF